MELRWTNACILSSFSLLVFRYEFVAGAQIVPQKYLLVGDTGTSQESVIEFLHKYLRYLLGTSPFPTGSGRHWIWVVNWGEHKDCPPK